MAYIVKATERVRGIGADYETKAMLYLMSCRDDSSEIYCFAIDFFNDVTGLNNFADKAWDVQSKGKKAGCAKDIGREMTTLFKNYMSELTFDYLILFLAAVPDTFRVNSSLNTFGIENVKEKALLSVKEGLYEEALKKNYIDVEWITDKNIENFLRRMTFVVDELTKADYIKKIISINPRFIPRDDVLDSIFNTIRTTQSGKKDVPVEGEEISHLHDVFSYGRTIKAKDIRLMIINSIVNRDIMDKGIPNRFFPVIKSCDDKTRKEIAEDCQLKLSTLLFDKTNTDSFWDLLGMITDTIENNPTMNTKQTYSLIEHEEAVRNPRLDVLSVQYLIAVMKEALE